ncbi:MAG: outer membrane protein assembly factor BamE [Alphaproteobacteria bacterium]|nr:outer membrane protein assembly factor BamE [Alphaproteobacteria bacterium]
MSIRNLFLLGLITFLSSSCSENTFLVHNGNMPSPEKISQISIGPTRQEVADILGSPSSISCFDGNTWIYMSSTFKKVAFFTPKEIDRNILNINFDNEGKVAEIITYDKDDGKQIKITEQETPTQGHNIGFFKKYFGGVGAYMPISTKDADNNL